MVSTNGNLVTGILANLPIFRHTPAAMLAALARKSRTLHMPRGGTIGVDHLPAEVAARRLATLSRLMQPVERPLILLTTVNAIQRAMRELPAESRVAQAQAPVAVPAAPPFRTFTARTAAPRQAAAAAPVAGPEAEKGWSRIVDRFTVVLPPAQVWSAFADVPRVARCLPGAEFEAKDERNLEGELRFAFGPITAAFACSATVERDEATRTGILRGSGSDRRGQSRAKGQVSYRLFEEAGGAATRVEVTFDYQLQGALAQFSRPGLVKDFVSHLIAEFARNLSAMTGGGAAAEHAPRASLGLGDLLAILFARLKRWLGF